MSEEATATEIVVPNRPEIYPDSRLKAPKEIKRHRGMNWVPIFCANCGEFRGNVPEENCNFAFALCDPCAEKLGPITNTYFMPDHVFWDKVKKAQIEKFGRELTGPEIVEALKDDDHILSKLARERAR